MANERPYGNGADYSLPESPSSFEAIRIVMSSPRAREYVEEMKRAYGDSDPQERRKLVDWLYQQIRVNPYEWGINPADFIASAAPIAPPPRVQAPPVAPPVQAPPTAPPPRVQAPPVAPPVQAPPAAPPPRVQTPPVAPPVQAPPAAPPPRVQAPPVAPPVASPVQAPPAGSRPKKGRGNRAPGVDDAEFNAQNLAALAVASKSTSDLGAALGSLASASKDSANFDDLKVSKSNETAPNDFLKELGNSAEVAETHAADDVEFLRDRSALEKAKDDAPMWLTSLAAHLLIAIILALIVTNVSVKNPFEVVSEPGFGDEVVLDEVYDPEVEPSVDQPVEIDAPVAPETETEVTDVVPDMSAFNDESASAISITETDLGSEAPFGEVDNLLGSLMGDDLSGRGENKAAALAVGGGSEGSEKAVALALAWLAEHQNPDGSWSYDLRACPTCRGQCSHSGTNASTIAATAMGLLPFLAAGNTPTTGKYKRLVAKGLNYLLDQGRETENGLSFHDGAGNMYSHGLATITLCETYAMLSTRDRSRYRNLQYAAQSALNFIEAAQAADGGWRYNPGQAGDTSVTGWQMMALKSGQLAGFAIDNGVVAGARSFLRDVVSFEYETRYNYVRGSSESPATDAIGLLCRLYLDWRADNDSLLKGAARLSGFGPNFNNPYYNYYAAQLMNNVGGAMWRKWNEETRDQLAASQILDGHERGSWFPENPDGHCQTGGRLYATSLNCMVLEVYYRHMPLYQKMESATNFPLDLPVGVKKNEESKSQSVDQTSQDAGQADDKELDDAIGDGSDEDAEE